MYETGARNLGRKAISSLGMQGLSTTNGSIESLAEFSFCLEKMVSILSIGVTQRDVWKYLGAPRKKEGGNFAGNGRATVRVVSQRQSERSSINVAIIDRLKLSVSRGDSISYSLEEAVSYVSEKWKSRSLRTAKARTALKLLDMWGDLSLCWKLSENHGLPLTTLIEGFHAHAEDCIDTEYRRMTALSGPIMTVKIMLALPLAALAMTSFMGMDVLGFLVKTPAGWICCLSAIGALAIAKRWTGSMIMKVQDPLRDAERSNKAGKKSDKRKKAKPMTETPIHSGREGRNTVHDVALFIDLLGGLLECGSGLERALDALEPYVDTDIMQEIRGNGIQQEYLQKPVSSELEVTISVLRLSRDVGSPSRKMLISHANWLRKKRRYEVEKRTETLGVKVVLPLGLCVLPAFFCIVVVPVVAVLANGVF